MGVNINPTWRHKIAPRIDFGGGCAFNGADGANLGNQPVFDCNFGIARGRASAVN